MLVISPIRQNSGWFNWMDREFQHIVRILNTDLDGTKGVACALTKIKGINIRLAQIIVKKADVNPEDRLGFLSNSSIEKIGETVENIQNYNLPGWIMNRRKDIYDGKDHHLITSDLDLQTKENIDRMKSMKSWKGYRHAYGLKVRGQRTRTTGRKARSVGVKKKSLR